MIAQRDADAGYLRTVVAQPRLIVRADGGVGIGVGHLARTLALAQAWNARGGKSVLATDHAPAIWTDRFEAEGCEIVEPMDVPLDETTAWWVVDGYTLRGAKEAPDGSRVALIDDDDGAGTRGRGAALVVDQNLGARADRYPDAKRVLTGPRYALLRKPIAKVSARRQPDVVVVFGGAPGPELRRVGAAIERDPRLRRWSVEFCDGSATVDAVIPGAKLVIAAAGSVTWEICRAGTAALLVTTAPNQAPVAEHVATRGAALHVPLDLDVLVEEARRLLASPVELAKMAASAAELVDGLGARRVACRMRSELLELRSANRGDAATLFRWANEAGTRRASFRSDPITWDDHVNWFERRLNDPLVSTYLAADPSGADVGVVRFDGQDSKATIGVTIDPNRRGKGWGGALVRAGTDRWASDRRGIPVVARIKPWNRASIVAFEDADYTLIADSSTEELRYAYSEHAA